MNRSDFVFFDGTSIIDYLSSFMRQNEQGWEDEQANEQARAIFTTICLHGGIEVGTRECDWLLEKLYRETGLTESDVSIEQFKEFMVSLIRY